jgi:hypothetical protein
MRISMIESTAEKAGIEDRGFVSAGTVGMTSKRRLVQVPERNFARQHLSLAGNLWTTCRRKGISGNGWRLFRETLYITFDIQVPCGAI